MICKCMRASRLFATACLVTAVFASLVPSAQAQDAQDVTITSPFASQHLSVGMDDVDLDAAGFQLDAAGKAPAGSTVTVTATPRGSDTASDFGTATADPDGDWAVTGTLAPGEWTLNATSDADGADPAPARTFNIVLRYVFPFYDRLGALTNDILVAAPAVADNVQARASVRVAGTDRGVLTLPAGGNAVSTRFAGLKGGPVLVDSLDGYPLVVTQRTRWTSGDLEEVHAVYDGSLDDQCWFSWYDSVGSGGRDWIHVTNMGDSTATIRATLGETVIGEAGVLPGQSRFFRKDGVRGGPVKVSSDQPVLASRRTLWTNQNFTELNCVPDRNLHTDYAFTWYDSVGTNGRDWVLIANPDDAGEDAFVFVDHPSFDEEQFFVVEPGQAIFPRFPGVRGGPLTISSDVPVIVTQRALWSGGASFEETHGISTPDTGHVYWQSWYDHKGPLPRGEWMLQANPFCDEPAEGQDASVDYSLSGPTIGHTSTLDVCESEFPTFKDKREGPIVAQGTETPSLPFLQTKRTLWGPGREFMELNGVRGTLVSGVPDVVEAPGSVTVTDVANDDGTSLSVSWAPVAGDTVDGYVVYRSRSTETERRIAHLPSQGCADSCGPIVDDGLHYEEADVRYRVVALSAGIVEGVSATGTGTAVDDAPTAPTFPDTGGVISDDAAVILDFNDNPENDIDGYTAYFVEDPAVDNQLPTQCSGAGAPADGAYTAFDPDTTTPEIELTTESRIRVTGLTNDTRYCFKVSATDFKPNESPRSAVRVATPGEMPPTVAVTAPNGGEVFAGGSQQEITYTAEDPNADVTEVKTEFTLDSTAGTPSYETICTEPAPSGSCSWTVPAGANTQNAQVRVTVTDEAGNVVSDNSDANFAIDSAAPVVQVTAPAAGSTHQGGTVVAVTWTSDEPNSADNGVDIEWSTDGNTWQAAQGCTDTADDDTCDWTLPSIDSQSVRVRVTITDRVGLVGSGTSGVFSIATPPAVPTGLTATPGDRQAVLDWADNTEPDLAGYNVYRATQGGVPAACPADGAYTKQNPSLVVGSTFTATNLSNDNTVYCFKVTAVDSSGNESPRTGQVTADPAPVPPNVTVTAPNGGEVIRGGSTFNITWTDTDPDANKDRVRIEYTTAGTGAEASDYVLVTSSAPNNGSFAWTVPSTNTSQLAVKVTATDLNGNTDDDVSDSNGTIDSQAPQITNVQVTAGDGVPHRGGEAATVTWTTTEANPAPGGLTVRYSTDGGVSFPNTVPGCTGVDNTGTCEWTLPSITEPDVVVQVVLMDRVGLSGSGTSPQFAIDSQTPGAPSITSVNNTGVAPGPPHPDAQGSDRSPRTVVKGPSGGAFAEGGTIRIFVNATNCAGTPAGTKAVTAGAGEVVFNDGDAVDYQVPTQNGNHSLYACHEDAAGNRSPISAEIVYRFDSTAPSQVTGLTATGGPNRVDLDWNDATDNLSGISEYRIYRAVDPQQNPVPSACAAVDDATYGQIGTSPVSNFSDTGSGNGTRHCYKVAAVDGVGNVGPRSSAVAGTGNPPA